MVSAAATAILVWAKNAPKPAWMGAAESANQELA
jgi:hypothetical protein